MFILMCIFKTYGYTSVIGFQVLSFEACKGGHSVWPSFKIENDW